MPADPACESGLLWCDDPPTRRLHGAYRRGRGGGGRRIRPIANPISDWSSSTFQFITSLHNSTTSTRKRRAEGELDTDTDTRLVNPTRGPRPTNRIHIAKIPAAGDLRVICTSFAGSDFELLLAEGTEDSMGSLDVACPRFISQSEPPLAVKNDS